MREKDSPERERTNGRNGGEKKEFLPPLDFTSIVLPLYTQAMLKLGLLADADAPVSGESLELVRRLIDLLDLLKDRTKGNLNPAEEKLLESCLQELKTNYLEKAKVISF
ncbi:MAG: DUF1844 domain-containing protein [Acidobacteriota bacterium]